jgi:hypothetical protein
MRPQRSFMTSGWALGPRREVATKLAYRLPRGARSWELRADQVRDRWKTMQLRQRQAFIALFVEKVVILPALRKGRPKKGVTDEQRIKERLDGTGGGGIRWRL